jgi:hypothetical protein
VRDALDARRARGLERAFGRAGDFTRICFPDVRPPRIRARSTPADARAASARGLCESLRVFSRVNRRVVARYEVVRRAIECVNGRQLDATSNCSQKRARGFSGPVASLGFQILAGLR